MKGKEFRGKVLSVLLSAAMLVTLTPLAAAPVFADTLPAPVNGTVSLSGDTHITAKDLDSLLNVNNSLTVDLANHTLTIDDTTTVSIPEGKSLTLKNGTVQASGYAADKAVFLPGAKAGLTLDAVTVNTSGTAVLPGGDAASVTVQNGSRITTSGYYTITTNASRDKKGSYVYGSGFNISLSDSEFTAARNDGDDTAILINVPATLTMKNCNVSGDRQGLFVRAGTANITGGRIRATGSNAASLGNYRSSEWGSGNEAPSAAILAGNYVNGAASSYEADAVVNIDNTVIESGNASESFAIYADSNNTYKSIVTVTNTIQDQITGKVSKGQHDAAAARQSQTSSITLNGTAVTDTDADANCPSRKFTDLDTSQWYHEAVDYVLNNRLFGGEGNGIFAPDGTMTRAMFVTVISRMDGIDASQYGGSSFTDVADGQWFSAAVKWASDSHIVDGVGNGRFDPDGVVTREQMAVIMQRYANYKKLDTTGSGSAKLNTFTDRASVSGWARDAMIWATDKGLINGTSATTLDPQAGSTRAQVAQVIMNYNTKVLGTK